MSVHERIAKLQAILARVTQRALAPRVTPMDGAAARAVAQAVVDEPVISSEPITPHDVELSERTEEAPMVAEVESRERIVAAPEIRAEARADDAEPIPISVDTGERPVALHVEEASESPEISVSSESESEVIDVGEEEPPASSRRPIALEPKLEELAFGEAAPVETIAHTPPPESGRQVAAAPVGLDFDGEFTGVRPREPEEVAVTVVGDVPKAQAEAPPMDLSPEATGAKLPATAAVAFEGSAPVFKPATFGELLDATLML